MKAKLPASNTIATTQRSLILDIVVALVLLASAYSELAVTASGALLPREKSAAACAQSPTLVVRRRDYLMDKNARGQEAIFFLSHNGQTLATKADQAQKVTLWNVATKDPKAELRTGARFVYYCAFSPDDRWFMAATLRGEVSVWNAQTGELKTHITVGYKGSHAHARVAIDWMNWLVAIGNSRKPLIDIWDLRTGQVIRTLEHPPRQNPFSIFHPEREPETKDDVTDLAFTLDGRKLLSVSFLFNRIYVWDLESGKLEKILGSHRNTIYDLVLDPGGQFLATPSRDGTAGLWDLRAMKWITSIGDFSGRVVCAAFSPDGRTLAATSGDWNQKVKLWDVEDNRLITTLTGFKKNVHLYNENFSPDGRIVVVPSIGSHKPGLKLWDARTGQLLAVVDDAAQPVAFTPDGNTMLTGGPKGEVLLWDVVRN